MNPRISVALSATALLAAPVFLHAQDHAVKLAAKKSWTVPRTPDGYPDLQGIWSNATLTPMQRPAEFKGKATISDTEAAVYEKHDLKTNDIDDPEAPLLARAGSGSGATAVGGYNNLFIDRGSQLERVDGVKRTSLIIDPPDGMMPPRVPGSGGMYGRGAGRGGRDGGYNESDNVKSHPLSERCLLGFGSTSGPPMLPVLYNNNYQIIETPKAIMILVEMIHDVRVIRMNATHKPPEIRQWLGDSIGHWEGDTLVVDTTNFTDKTRFMGSTEDLHTVERFQRVDQHTILYRVTIEDPKTWTRPWTIEYPFLATKGPIYEYACHEGNYALDDILGGADKREETQGQGAAKR